MLNILTGGGSPWASALVFAASALAVWWAGSRLAGYADRFATATGIGGAVVGLVLLGGITSLPEIATSSTAALHGSAPLAVNNLLGGVSVQLLVLAALDLAMGRQALTSTVPRPDVLGYAAMNILLMTLAAGIIASGDLEMFGSGVGVGSLVLLLGYAACIAAAREMDQKAAWRPIGLKQAAENASGEEIPGEREAMWRLGLLIAAAALIILGSGYLLTRTGESLAERTGLGASFFGVTLLAAATSLPELSSALAAMRLKRPQLAIGDVFGGNLFDVLLIALVDVLYRKGPAMAEVGLFSVFAAVLGAALAAILIIGMIERRDRTVLRMGYDSLAIVIVYLAGAGVLYTLRGG